MTCRCRVLEADIEEIARDRDDALALLREFWASASIEDFYNKPWESLVARIAERFPGLTR